MVVVLRDTLNACHPWDISEKLQQQLSWVVPAYVVHCLIGCLDGLLGKLIGFATDTRPSLQVSREAAAAAMLKSLPMVCSAMPLGQPSV